MCFCCTWQAWAGYSGTPTEPSQITAENYSTYGFTASNYSAFVGYYGISSAEELYGFAAKVNGGSTSIKGVLTADIVVNDSVLNADGSPKGTPTYSWTPIGTSSYNYIGTFDGNGHTISGLYFSNTNNNEAPNGGNRVGLFGYINSGATIAYVGVVDSYFKGYSWVGGICGYNYYGTISNCFSAATVNATLSGSSCRAGGICGYQNNGLVSNCYNTGNVYGGGTNIGGICGYKAYGTIENSYNEGKVSGIYYNIGGICGCNEYSTATITGCFNVGTVSGSYNVGGISGKNNSGIITNCYYLDSCAYDASNKVQNGIGYGSQGYATTDVAGKTTSATTADFKSGKVATALGFYQTIGTDSLPVLDKTHGTVYRSEPCPGEYSNEGVIEKEHNYVDGVCTGCGKGENEPLLTDGWYEIANSTELYWFAARVNSGYNNINGRLVADIVVNDSVLKADGTLNGDGSNFTVWTPIGIESYKYAGIFDGNGHTVSGLYYNNSISYVGLFGYVTDGTIRNVGVVDSYIKASNYVGAIVGRLFTGTSTITNCFNEATVSSYGSFTGGIAGHAYGSSCKIINCYNKGKISGSGQYTGGICGILENSSSLSGCFNVGKVTSTTTSYLASIAPKWSNAGSITNSVYLEGTSTVAGDGISATADDFESGKVAYLLNGKKSNNDVVWYQTIGEDELPVMDNSHSVVYASAPCASYFSNTDGSCIAGCLSRNGRACLSPL